MNILRTNCGKHIVFLLLVCLSAHSVLADECAYDDVANITKPQWDFDYSIGADNYSAFSAVASAHGRVLIPDVEVFLGQSYTVQNRLKIVGCNSDRSIIKRTTHSNAHQLLLLPPRGELIVNNITLDGGWDDDSPVRKSDSIVRADSAKKIDFVNTVLQNSFGYGVRHTSSGFPTSFSMVGSAVLHNGYIGLRFGQASLIEMKDIDVSENGSHGLVFGAPKVLNIKNFNLSHNYGHGLAVTRASQGASVTSGVSHSNGGIGVVFGDPPLGYVTHENFRIEDVRVFNNTQGGITIDVCKSSKDLGVYDILNSRILNNEVHNNGLNGISYNCVNGGYIAQNNVNDNEYAGISLTSSSGLSVDNNHALGNGTWGIKYFDNGSKHGGSNIFISNNTALENAIDDYVISNWNMEGFIHIDRSFSVPFRMSGLKSGYKIKNLSANSIVISHRDMSSRRRVTHAVEISGDQVSSFRQADQ